jgi:hypothetical protein
MAHVNVDKLVGKTQRVKAKMDIGVSGISVKAGDTVDVTEREARFLRDIGRADFVEIPTKDK